MSPYASASRRRVPVGSLSPQPGRSTSQHRWPGRRAAKVAQLDAPLVAPCTETTGGPSPTAIARGVQHVDQCPEPDLGDQGRIRVGHPVTGHRGVADGLHQRRPMEYPPHGTADPLEAHVVDVGLSVESLGHHREVDVAVERGQVVPLPYDAVGVDRDLRVDSGSSAGSARRKSRSVDRGWNLPGHRGGARRVEDEPRDARQRDIGRQRCRGFEAIDLLELSNDLERALAGPTGGNARCDTRTVAPGLLSWCDDGDEVGAAALVLPATQRELVRKPEQIGNA